MGAIASQITSLATVYSTVYSSVDQRITSKLRVTGLCEGNSPVTDEFPAQMASNAENVSIWWCHYDIGTQLRGMESNNLENKLYYVSRGDNQNTMPMRNSPVMTSS